MWKNFLKGNFFLNLKINIEKPEIKKKLIFRSQKKKKSFSINILFFNDFQSHLQRSIYQYVYEKVI